jgi:serine protease
MTDAQCCWTRATLSTDRGDLFTPVTTSRWLRNRGVNRRASLRLRRGAHRQVLGAAAVAIVIVAAYGVPARATASDPDTVCSVAKPGPTSMLVGVAAGAVAGVTQTIAHGRLGTVVGHIRALDLLEIAAAQPGAVASLPGVRFVEREQVFQTLDEPSDPLLRSQWALTRIGAARAWNYEVGLSNSVSVGILDTGIDLHHPDLEANTVDGFNALSPGDSAQDDHFHGTHVAGIIAASTNNGIGVAGVSWAAKTVAVKVLDHGGSGTSCQVLAGMVWAAQHDGIRVMNMSLGAAGVCGEAMQEAVEYARSRGVVIVAAAGNGGAGFNLPDSPADCQDVLGVGATDADDRPAAFSNFGSYVDIAAPGVNVLSTLLDRRSGAHTYGELSGTSMASPVIAGVAALLLAAHPTWTPADVERDLTSTAHDLGPHGRDDHFGAGRVDAAAALRCPALHGGAPC